MKKSDFQNVDNVGVFPITNSFSIEVLFLDESEEKVYYARNIDGKRKKVQFAKLGYSEKNGHYFNGFGRIHFKNIIKGAF